MKIRLPRSHCPITMFVATSLAGSLVANPMIRSAVAADASAAGTPASQPGTPASQSQATPGGANGAAAPGTTAPQGIWDRSALLGNLGGLRSLLAGGGVTFGLSETDEVLDNPTGGERQGVVFEGLTEASVGVDLGGAIGLAGGTLNISALQIHGRGLSTNDLDNLNTVSGIEANRSTRLFEAWYQQAFIGDKLDVKVGQLSADTEFAISQYAGLFINASFGWPGLAAVDLPSGGPAYPLATPGIRLRLRPTPEWIGMIAVFNGSPAGLAVGNPQQRDASGTNFDLASGVFVIGEVQYLKDQGNGAADLSGTYKFGAYYNSNAFTDQFFTVTTGSPASAFGSYARSHRNDWTIYGVMDQLIYRPTKTSSGGLAMFMRVMGAPGDRNLVNVFADGGITYKGIGRRDGDTVGLGFNWLRISDTARAEDALAARYDDGSSLIRTSETALELSYQAQVAPWLIAQPDLQYVFKPGGGIADPLGGASRIPDALIAGLRISVVM